MGKQRTNEFLLGELRRFCDENGRVPTRREFKPSNGYPSSKVYSDRFGTWNDALKMAGLNCINFVGYTKEMLIHELQKYYNDTNTIPTVNDFNRNKQLPSATTYASYFGSWNDALKEAGLEVNVVTDYSKDFLINELKRFYAEYNRSPMYMDFKIGLDFPSANTYVKYFGSWNNALELAGLEINEPYTEEFLIDELKRYYIENDKVPILDDFNNDKNYPSSQPYIVRFGSWNNALIAAGLEVNQIKRKLIGDEYCTNCGSIKTSQWNYINNERVCHTCYDIEWRKNNPDRVRVLKLRHNLKRRNYGFDPLNEYFEGSEAHHLWLTDNKDATIYIPNFLHKLYMHNHKKSETMYTINVIALDFLINESMYMNLYMTGNFYDE